MSNDKQTKRYKSIIVDGVKYKTNLNKKFETRKKYEPQRINIVHAVIPGTIRSVFVKQGNTVNANDRLLVLEAMKMKNIIVSPIDGIVKKVYVKPDQTVVKNEILIEFE